MWKSQLQIEKQNQSDSDSTQSSDSEINPYTGKKNESQEEEGGYSPGGDNDGYQFGIYFLTKLKKKRFNKIPYPSQLQNKKSTDPVPFF